MNEPSLSPTSVLEERLNDLRLSHSSMSLERQLLHIDAYLLALQTIDAAANAGNVTCIHARTQILRILP